MSEQRNASKQQMIDEHTPQRVRERLEQQKSSYLSDFIYGAIDGTVTTFAVVSGVAGASLSSGIVIVLGLANLIGDGFSMAASNFLGTRADGQLQDKARRDELRQIELHPDGEREEIRQIFQDKGFEGELLERVVDVICSDKSRWVETMLTDELGIDVTKRSAIRAAMATFIAFVLAGAVPLLPYVAEPFIGSVDAPFLWSCILTAVTFFSVGAVKARFVHQRWYWSGSETLLLGGAAAMLAYIVGLLLRGVA